MKVVIGGFQCDVTHITCQSENVTLKYFDSEVVLIDRRAVVTSYESHDVNKHDDNEWH